MKKILLLAISVQLFCSLSLSSIGTPFIQIALGKNADGRLELFAVGEDGIIYHRWQDVPNGNWGDWNQLGGTSIQQISIGRNADGRLELFALGGDRSVYNISQTSPNGIWGSWGTLGGSGLVQISVGRNADGRLELFAIGGDGAIYNIWQVSPNSGWSSWSGLGGSGLLQISVGTNADGRLELFAIGGDRALYNIWQTAPNCCWSGWSGLGGGDLQRISVGSNADGRIEIFAIGGDHAVYNIWQTAPNCCWSAWSGLGGSDLRQITTENNAEGRLVLFAIGGNKSIYHNSQIVPNGNWSDWTEFDNSNQVMIIGKHFIDQNEIPEEKEVVTVDNDFDGMDDNIEHYYLEKYRPYYRFSIHHGQTEQYRPTDINWFLERSELLESGDEDDSPLFDVNQIRQNPEIILATGSSNITVTKNRTDFYVNPLHDVPGINISDPGRHGNDWNEVFSNKNTGLYGHVVPIHLNSVEEYDKNSILSSENQGSILFYKIEYWQFFGFNEADMAFGVGNHEADWTTVQLLYNTLTQKVEAVFHYAHGKIEFRFYINNAGEPLYFEDPDTREFYAEYRGKNFDKYADIVELIDNYSNNTLRFSQDPNTKEFTHPMAYIEWGAHEFWPSEKGFYPGVPNHDGNSYSYLTSTPPNLGEVEFPLSETKMSKAILQFNGYWGAYNGPPVGPTLHRQWTWPASSAIRWLIEDKAFTD